MTPRRFTRSQANKPNDAPNGTSTEELQSRKRSRPDKTTKKADVASIDESQDGALPAATTPVKRRKIANADLPPPITPTPAAVKLMAGLRKAQDSQDGVKNSDPSNRPAKPNHTNATLVTPGGRRAVPMYSTFEDSPSKTSARATTSTSSLLEEACAHLTKIDPSLQSVIDKHPCQVFSPEGLSDEVEPFSALSSGIMAQQVSGAAAASIKKKFIALFDEKDCPNGFPIPKVVSKTPIPRLREAGLSQRKAEYIQGLAEKFDNGELTIDMLLNGTDEDIMQKLVAVRGLGAWSVEMFMCFGLKRMDIFSTGDLGVQRGMASYDGRNVSKLKAKGGGKWKYMSEKDMLEISEKFRPYRSLFMWYMWRIEDVDVSAMQGSN